MASHSSVRKRSARGETNLFATTEPSIMSATTAIRGRPLTRTDTVAPPSQRLRLRSTPTIRGGHRNPGATNPRLRSSRPKVRAVAANSVVVASMSRRVSRRGVAGLIGTGVGAQLRRSSSPRRPPRTVVSVETGYNPAQQRVIDLLGRSDERPTVDPDLATSIRSDLEAAIAPFNDVLPDGKSYENRFFLNKQALTNVHSCESYYLNGSGEFEWNLANCRGTVVHKAIEVSINLRHPMPPTDLIEEAIERLSNDSAKSISLFLATLDEFSRAELIGDCSALFTRFSECFPPIKRSWIPAVETPVALNLADGRVRISGKVDLALGRPPDKVIIDVKTGRAAAAHYDDLRLYALIDFLAIGMAPRKVASYYLDSAEIHHEDITEGTLLSAARRLQDGLVRAIELKYAHSPAARRPSGICNWCTLNTDCDVGVAYLEQRKADEGW